MKQIEYRSPKDNLEKGEMPQHHFDLIIEGKKIGGVEIDFFSKPLPFYQVSDLYIDFHYKGRGFASELMGQVEKWLIERKKPGVLVDSILEGDPAQGMYEKRGWLPVPNSNGLHVFNWPQDVSLSVLKVYALRQTPLSERSVKT